MAKVDAVAEAIVAAGGVAESARVDALDEQAVDAHLDAEVADTAAFIASDGAGAMTATVADLSAGSVVD